MQPLFSPSQLALLLTGVVSTFAAKSDGLHAAKFPIEQVDLPVLNGSESANPHSLSNLFGRQGTGRCFTASGERFDCMNPAIDSCCQGAAKAGCCDGTKKLQCIVPANTEAFCCYNESTACGTECCAYGWTCCSSSSSTCCSDTYGQCCGGRCCESSRQCCGGECCSIGFECSANGNSCVRKTTPVLTVTSTTVVSSQGTNVAYIKKAGEGMGLAGLVVAAAGLM
ncbi:hypothetical protein BKA63DRAFT_553002 [Paraphoma chrysanthemicola]|nr:hypothetical protein BKA63DRAFT_553002 [Paraphoma chrysanthemicola]